MLRKGINLIVFSDGYIEVVPRGAVTYSESTEYFNEMSYLVISLNACLNRFFPNKNFSPNLDTFELSDKEIAILAELRSGDFDEINIHMINGDIHRFDTKTKHMGEIEKIADILNNVSYGEFTIKKVNGKISFIESVTKNKV